MNAKEYRTFATPTIPDPGDGGTIGGHQGIVSLSISGGAETRLVDEPTNVGDTLLIWIARAGGGVAITFPSPINLIGNTILSFVDSASWAELKACPGSENLTSPSWRLCCEDGAQAS